MAFAMSSGLLAGVVTSIFEAFDLMTSTVIGMITGVFVGAIFGRVYHWGAVLDGFLAGVMGGMMGAMTGEMLHPIYHDSIVKMMLVVHVVVFLMIMAMFKDELHVVFPPFVRFVFFHPVGLLLLFLLFFVTTEWTGPIIEPHDVQDSHHSTLK
ncbi:hypothetical protein [Bacillus sp. FJAT-47783]|uniref:hypothetical protein n=1 Tax=Bacillus sp. FJAT-47783 TaxID=2922712 RepID=UPI001FADFF3D|nr:hypothetical protein [Bacillus sp. FJAT-47783]